MNHLTVNSVSQFMTDGTYSILLSCTIITIMAQCITGYGNDIALYTIYPVWKMR